MKKIKWIFPVIISLIVYENAFSQSFAPVGATWYYGTGDVWSSYIGYTIVKSEKDTVVKSKKCTLIKGEPYCGMYGMLGDRKTYVFEEDSIVYFLTSDFDDFQILYNFKARKGDSWTLKFKNRESTDSIVVQIDSVYSTAINRKELIKQNVSYFYTLKSLKIPSVIVERIGDLFYLFNFYDFHIACDATYTTGLRCYHDDFIGYYNTSTYRCDYTNVSTKEIIIEDCIITPNPCLDYFTVYNVDNTLCKYSLVNSYGRLMSKDKVNASCTQVDMSKFSPGIYFVKLYGTNGLNKVVKVLKNGF